MRTSIRTYLNQARKQLQSPQSNGTRFVVGNESADLDSIACALVYGYILTSSRRNHNEAIVIPITNLPAADLSLRPELTALLQHADLKPEHLITLDDLENARLDANHTEWTLVDHNVPTGILAKHYSSQITGVIDHHEDEKKIQRTASPRIIEKSGSCNSLVAMHCRPVWDDTSARATSIGAAVAQDDGRLLDDAAYTSTWTAQVAKLSIGAILVDTINMTDENKVTEHDRKALRYLEALVNIAPRVGKDYDRGRFYNELQDAKTNVDAFSTRDLLRKDYKEWTEDGLKLGTAVIVKPLSYVKNKDSDWVQACYDFAMEREIDILAITTAFSEDKPLEREIALFCKDSGKSVEATQAFINANTDELQLKKLDIELKADSTFKWSGAWSQHNLAASRKQTAPLLREAMKKG